jgi:Cohesin domain
MIRNVRKVALGAMLALVAAASQADTITVVPSSGTAQVGSTFSVTVAASNFVGGAAPSIGAFDLGVSFDSTILSLVSVAFGPGLAFSGGAGSIQDQTPVVGGVFSVAEVSLESETALNTQQLDAFALFTITFNALSVGTSQVSLALNGLSNAAGDSLNANLVSGSVNVVPLPSAAWLLLSGLAAFGVTARRRAA